jgi:UrcA family protein
MKTLTAFPRVRFLLATVAFAALASSLAPLCAAAGPISAATVVGNKPEVTVSYADLNLASADGAATLYHRIVAAASLACGLSYPHDDGLFTQLYVSKCERSAVRNAVQKVREPMLTAVYNLHNRDRLQGGIRLAQAR